MTMSTEQMQAELERLKAENEKLKAKKVKPLTLKVSEKGGVSLYGINAKWPVTLYGEGWLRLLAIGDEIKSFIEKNKEQLSWKNNEE